MTRVRDPRDFWAGVLFVGAGLFAVVGARRYPFGTTAAMGPGYFPTVLGWVLVGIGVVVSGRSLRPSKPLATVGAIRARPLVLVLAAVIVFGVALPRLGLAVASILLVAVSRTAAAGFRWVEVLVFAAALTAFCAAVFVWGLEMPMTLWPPFLGG
jgi:Tripartite tricarboxylate transporter TctB family